MFTENSAASVMAIVLLCPTELRTVYRPYTFSRPVQVW